MKTILFHRLNSKIVYFDGDWIIMPSIRYFIKRVQYEIIFSIILPYFPKWIINKGIYTDNSKKYRFKKITKIAKNRWNIDVEEL